MLIKPDIEDEVIISCLWDAYGLKVEEVIFLPLGADLNTAVYRVRVVAGRGYFLKLRRGGFHEAVVLVPRYLADLGIRQVIRPIETKEGRLWASFGLFKVILCPYVEGVNGIDAGLTEGQWVEFGETVKRLHSVGISAAITSSVPMEMFSSKWRAVVMAFLGRLENEVFCEPVAVEMALFLKAKTQEVRRIVRRAEELAGLLRGQPIEYVLCHGDIHGWNLLINTAGALYVVDWDTLIFAPKERDLMFIGAGIGDSGRRSIEEEQLFYKGYGETTINHAAIAYYRYERVIEDIGVYCEQIFLSDEGGDDRLQLFEYLKSNFLSNGTIERANEADR